MPHPIPDLFIDTARRDFDWLEGFGLLETRFNADNNGALLILAGPSVSLWLALEQADGCISCLVSCEDATRLPGGPAVLEGRPITKVYLSEILRSSGRRDQAHWLESIDADDPQAVVAAVRVFSDIAKTNLSPILGGDWTLFQSAARARKPHLPPESR
jgi:hypothetical protein